MNLEKYSLEKLEHYMMLSNQLKGFSNDQITDSINSKKQKKADIINVNLNKCYSTIEQNFNEGFYKGNKIELSLGEKNIKGVLTGSVYLYKEKNGSYDPWYNYISDVGSPHSYSKKSTICSSIKILKVSNSIKTFKEILNDKTSNNNLILI